MALAIGMGFFFIFITMIFVAIAVFLPEWLGITGKKAKQIIADQQAHETKTEAKTEDTSAPEVDKKI
ncbi:hypothetical protein D3C87_1728740 [compost metagenome]